MEPITTTEKRRGLPFLRIHVPLMNLSPPIFFYLCSCFFCIFLKLVFNIISFTLFFIPLILGMLQNLLLTIKTNCLFYKFTKKLILCTKIKVENLLYSLTLKQTWRTGRKEWRRLQIKKGSKLSSSSWVCVSADWSWNGGGMRGRMCNCVTAMAELVYSVNQII